MFGWSLDGGHFKTMSWFYNNKNTHFSFADDEKGISSSSLSDNVITIIIKGLKNDIEFKISIKINFKKKVMSIDSVI